MGFYFACPDNSLSNIYIGDYKIPYFDILVVGGGGAGAGCLYCGGAGGGGGGEVICCSGYEGGNNSFEITVGRGGFARTAGCYDGCPSSFIDGNNIITAKGGCRGYLNGGVSGTGCIGGCGNCGPGSGYANGGGGGGATGNGCNSIASRGGYGGTGLYGYGGGGGGGAEYWCRCNGGCGVDGGGNGGKCGVPGCNGTNCGGGGGGGTACARPGGNGACGVVDICYLEDGSCGISSATGGDCCYICNGYCVHRFTSDGTFTIVS